jgi:hypothetical protein
MILFPFYLLIDKKHLIEINLITFTRIGIWHGYGWHWGNVSNLQRNTAWPPQLLVLNLTIRHPNGDLIHY